MKNSRNAFARHVGALALGLGLASGAFAASPFQSTSNASAWTVSTALHGTDGDLASFDTNPLDQQQAILRSDNSGWLANVASGSNSDHTGDWTFFVFQQTFTLTAAEAATFDLKFTWEADDSGQGYADRGTWVPGYSLNGAPVTHGTWADGYSYVFGPTVDITGFHEGVNTLSSYVEGNGITDGMQLNVVSFASTVPEPGSMSLLLAGIVLLGMVARRARRAGR